MSDLGGLLRTWRDRVSPDEVGLPARSPRRAPGLRREELALLAGVSVDYLTRLEQGRATAPSAQVLVSLARALRLTTSERDHLFRLAGHAPPSTGQVSDHLPASVQRLLDRMDDVPVSVYDATWTLLAWNPLWAAVAGDPSTDPERNVLRRYFSGSTGRVRHRAAEQAAFEVTIVSDLRSVTGRYPDDVRLATLVRELQASSPRFAELWASGVVSDHREDRKTIDHPQVGALTVDCDVLTVAGSDLRIIVYSAVPGSADADKLALLRVLGTQQLADRG